MGTYVITGGASGIGLAITEQLKSDGHHCLSLDIQEADIIADLSTAEGRALAINAITESTSGELAGLVTSAGVGSHVPNNTLITEVNYFGTVDLIKGLRGLLARNNAAVLMISSNSAPMQTNADFVNALLADHKEQACMLAADMQGQPVYSGTKQAVTRWMRHNTAAYAAEGIRMNAIGPGYTRTPLSIAAEANPKFSEAIKQFVDSIPVGRPGVPQDMADAASFLLGERAGFICGAMLYVDGGHDAMLRPDSL